MIRYLVVSTLTFLLALAPAWSDDEIRGASRYQVVPDAQVPDRTGKPRAQTILIDTVTGRTWTLAPGTGSNDALRATWTPIPVQDFDTQQALASPGGESADSKPEKPPVAEDRQAKGYRDRLWNYERDP